MKREHEELCASYVEGRWHPDDMKQMVAAIRELSAEVEQTKKDVQRVAEEMATKMAAPAHARAERAEAELASLRERLKDAEKDADELRKDLSACLQSR